MKNLITYIKAFISLGSLAIIIFLMVAAILIALFSQPVESFDNIFNRMDVLNTLEDTVSVNLAEMQLQEARDIFAYAYEEPDPGGTAKAIEANDAISTELTSLEDNGEFSGEFSNFTDVSPQLDEFNQARADHRELFDETVSTIQNDDLEEIFAALDDLEFDNQNLNYALRDLIIPVEHDRLNALEALPDDIGLSILITVLGMVFSMILALAGYHVIASTVRPLRHLRNTVSAIGGDLYRSESNPGLHQKDATGSLARALDDLAHAEQHRNESIKQEIEKLRQELYESRRRRLKVYRETEKAG